MAEQSGIQVVVRLRPMSQRELKGNTLPVVTASTDKKEVTVIKGTGARTLRNTYGFDNVFTSFSTQKEVFDSTLAPVISDVLGGYESTVFAYGQTGTGKTHTMEGDINSSENRGVIPRAAFDVFRRLADDSYVESKVTASFLEIYNEELGDLLCDVDLNDLTALQQKQKQLRLGRGPGHIVHERPRDVRHEPHRDTRGVPRGCPEAHGASKRTKGGGRDQDEQTLVAFALRVYPARGEQESLIRR
jgi:kinesin family protein 11